MSTKNPFAGGPDFVRSLLNAIEVVPHSFALPPKASGAATSVRLPEERVVCLDAIAKNSGWTRNEVVNALLDKGLFVLFHEMKDAHVEQIMGEVAIKGQAAQQLSPPTHGVSNMEAYNGHKIGTRATQKPSGRWSSIYQYAMSDNQTIVTSAESDHPDFATEMEAIEFGRQQARAAVDRNLPWTIFVGLPLPGSGIGKAGIPGHTVIPPINVSTAESARARCLQLKDAGYSLENLHVMGPDGIHWDGFEIRSQLGL